jgi:ADP-ribosylglycohydrolase
MTSSERSRVRGSLIGLAVGDALGVPVEFKPPGTFDRVQTYLGGGPFATKLQPGEWTDDTSMALCLAASLTEVGWDLHDQMQRYTRWYRLGELSSIGVCFDIGNQTRDALTRFHATGDELAGSTDRAHSGNGSIMRLCPVPLAYRHDLTLAIERSGESSRTTHGSVLCVDACRFLGLLIALAARGTSARELFSPDLPASHGLSLCPEIAEIAAGSYRTKSPPDIVGSGYVVRSLEAALWAVHRAYDFRSAVLGAVNLGDDADTTGAIAGQLAGAIYGEDSIPPEYRQGLAHAALLDDYAERLCRLQPVR